MPAIRRTIEQCIADGDFGAAIRLALAEAKSAAMMAVPDPFCNNVGKFRQHIRAAREALLRIDRDARMEASDAHD